MDEVEEVRNQARARIMESQRRVRRTFEKKVAPRHFQAGDLILKRAEARERSWISSTREGSFKILRS